MSTLTLDDYKLYIGRIMDVALITFIALFIISFCFYLTILTSNIANLMPLLALLGVGVTTWTFRFQIAEAAKESIRPLLVQWTLVCVGIIIVCIFIILIYPIG